MASSMEELQEADVLWPDAHHHDYCHRHRRHHHHRHHADQQHHAAAAAARPVRPAPSSPSSAPVRIPEMARARPTASRQLSWALSHHHRDDDDDDDDDDVDGAAFVVRRASASEAAAIVPPHVLAARRCAAERRVASSVCVGHGRTLKGRDLCAVRNAVLHMTGFLSSSDKY
ncbi:hypothetical protein ACP4OV_025068 [Aristida adscensionis]